MYANPHEQSDLQFAAMVLQQKLDGMPNPNTPTAHKLSAAIHKLVYLDTLEKTQPKNWWFLQYSGSDGHHIRAEQLSTEELQRIAHMVARGFTAGEIDPDAYDSKIGGREE